MGNKERFYLLVAVLLSINFAISQETSVNVPNSPPTATQTIPDLFLPGDTPSLNVFDLDDYFDDINGDTLAFTYTSLNNVTVSIDSENRVSFFPDTGYIGFQYMTFYANDSEYTTQSNQFRITIGEDTNPPNWTTPLKNRVNVYQSYTITFSTVWSDDRNLGNYTFSINEGSGWVNSTSQNFSGTTNLSSQSFQISAAGGVTVYWRFYASDAAGNLNVTDIQNFTVSNFVVGQNPPSGPSGGSSPGGDPSGGAGPGITGPPTFYSVDKSFIKVSLRQGDEGTQVIKIKNVDENTLYFNASISGVSSLTTVGDPSFSIAPGEEVDLLIDFTIPDNLMPDQYFGTLYLKSIVDTKIPIVIEVREFNAQVAINVAVLPFYKYVKTGRKVVASININNLADIRDSTPNLYYAIKDFNGNTLEFYEEQINLSDSYSAEKNLTVPIGTQNGEYLFYARVYNDDYIDLGSDTFSVGSKLAVMLVLKSLLYPIMILLLILLIAFLVLVYKRNKKKKRLLELYLLLNEMRSLVNKGKNEDALNIYKRIKLAYGQHIPKGFIKDKEKLKEELTKFATLLKVTPIKVESSPPKNETSPKEPPKNPSTESNEKPAPTPPTKPTPQIQKPTPPTPKPAQKETIPAPASKVLPSAKPSQGVTSTLQPKPTVTPPTKPTPQIQKPTPPTPKPATPAQKKEEVK